MKALYVRLTLATALLLSLLGAALLALMARTSEQYAAEVRQRLDAGIAMYVVRELHLFEQGKVNEVALRELANRAMTVNPSAEVYLLDPQGLVLSAGSQPLPRGRTTVRLEPILQFLRAPENRPLFGDDPTSSTRQRVFSVAPINEGGRLEGYLYVVLGGRPERSIAEQLWGSYALRAGFLTLMLVIALTVAASAGLFFGLTRRLRTLDTAIDHWARGMPAGALRFEADASGGDEITALSRRFHSMSSAIEAQIQELKTTDELRRELIANVSHDLRTPLASLRGYIETALVKAPAAPVSELTAHLKVALRQAEQLGGLIEALFELARLESGTVAIKIEPVSIAELLQDIGMRFRVLAEAAHVKLSTQLDTSGVLVHADVALIERVISNLLDNAIRHTPEHGEVRLEMAAQDSTVRVRVCDNGCGIDPEQLPQIFDRFKPARAAADRERAGLGLSIVKRIIELHAQRVTVTSEKDLGTTVEFTLARVVPRQTSALAAAG
jgi:two-component system OmpR family sensor kinase